MMKKITHRYFDKEYWTEKTKSGYNNAIYNADDYIHEAKAELLTGLFDKDDAWLEAGCAYGWVVHELIKLGVDVQGFDISKYAIQHAPEVISGKVIQSDGLKYNLYPEDSFDVIYSFETAEHVAQKDCMLWLSNISRWLRRGGVLFMTICLGNNNFRGLDDPDESHQTLQTREWWDNYLGIVSLVENTVLFDKAMNAVVCTPKMLDRRENLLQKYNMHLFVRDKV